MSLVGRFMRATKEADRAMERHAMSMSEARIEHFCTSWWNNASKDQL